MSDTICNANTRATRSPLLWALVPWSLVIVLATLSSDALAQRHAPDPEAASGRTDKLLVDAVRHMVVAADPLAAEVGRDVLREGGSAVDAAIAVQLVLNLVEPQSSGLGGGAFLLHFDAATKTVQTYDGRETAPAAAKADRFLVDGRPMAFREAVLSGLSVGVPGTLALLELAHKRHGRLPWGRLFEPAIKLAANGFPVSRRLNTLLHEYGAGGFAPDARRYFFDASGAALPTGHRLTNPELADTLRAIAQEGSGAFYSGTIATAIVRAVNEAPYRNGNLTLSDLASYRAVERAPVCVGYRSRRVCGMAPPSSGGIAVAQTLMLLEPFDLGHGRGAAMNASALHLIAEAQKLAYADRDRYVADSDFVPLPAGLLDPNYVSARRALIDRFAAANTVHAGTPPGLARHVLGEDATIEAAGTSHISIIDADGNAVAMTSTIEAGFGSRLWAAGFLLNNEMTDFSFRPRAADGRLDANRIEPGKRPRSSMAPTIVLDEAGRVTAVLGSPGGSRIILYVLKSLIAMIDWDMDAQAMAALENFGSRGGGAFELEAAMPAGLDVITQLWASRPTIWRALKLKPYGHRMAFGVHTSGLHVILRRDDGTLEGGADPRREGIALGD
jgi:gamma-glutamyltranspeptidase/glutathione hydrolase